MEVVPGGAVQQFLNNIGINAQVNDNQQIVLFNNEQDLQKAKMFGNIPVDYALEVGTKLDVHAMLDVLGQYVDLGEGLKSLEPLTPETKEELLNNEANVRCKECGAWVSKNIFPKVLEDGLCPGCRRSLGLNTAHL